MGLNMVYTPDIIMIQQMKWSLLYLIVTCKKIDHSPLLHRISATWAYFGAVLGASTSGASISFQQEDFLLGDRVLIKAAKEEPKAKKPRMDDRHSWWINTAST